MGNKYYIYIITNPTNTVLYTGVTNNLARRIKQHREKTGSAFCAKYNICKLVYFEEGDNIQAAIAREKQIKGGSRKSKMELIAKENPNWEDLVDIFGIL